ncbi:type II toxin-antitoxin system HigB family toxin [Chitinophaga japonensis]|uniref:mRNA interferase HigB n=1 Tax=Chitinophaga japonensis TaxID=104662 RepID=A0A562T5W8_CHIJA|nr:type II toxin-antitoxin system HigB family toxin [Chitinophaga japonensis]TWI88892.1 mRNA interferase HigB [Chitinophaga japonensis]
MVIIARKVINEFANMHPDSIDPLWNWYRITFQADWRNFAEVKASFNHVDYVGNNLYIFNIRGNDYRLIARIIFKVRTVYIRFIGTHAQYDKVNLDDL